MMTARRRRLRAAVSGLLVLLALISACSGGTLNPAGTTIGGSALATTMGDAAPGSADAGTVSNSPPTPTVVPPVATVAAIPKFGTKGLSPIDPLTVTVSQGTIDDLKFTNPAGKAVRGKISADRTSWKVGEVLGFGKVYTVTGTATGTDGKQVKISGTYTTAGENAKVRNTVFPGDHAVVGVAAPISVSFGVEPQDRRLVEKNVSVTTKPAVKGAWGWIKHVDGRWALDYRTKEYWPAGTKVHVSAPLYGLKLGKNAYGAADLTSDFTIGRNQVVIANVNSHELVVKRNGAVVARYPASYGRGEDTGDPNLITRSGIHVVNEFFETKLMSNPRYGYSDVPERWAVRISDNGEFIHANPGSAGAQGNSNVTHGCVNLSLADADAYYHSAIWGDPVEVTGTSVTLGPDDGDIYTWAMPWSEWLTHSAL